MTDQLARKFTELYHQQPAATFFAPGRVNLIGEHIDYNGGLVMPCAITFGTWLLIAPNNDNVFRFTSLNFSETGSVPVRDTYERSGSSWFNYPLGVIQYFLEKGLSLSGMDFLYHGDLPIGASLSSSASIEVVTAFALNDWYNAGFSKLELVKLTKRVENEFMGLASGIMDQFAVTFGEASKALKLNCDTLYYEAVDCRLQDYVLAIVNTNKPRKLVESKYNERVGECRMALNALQSKLDIDNLCDIDSDTFGGHEELIADETVKRRARHVVNENDRVNAAAQALAANDLSEFGRLMYASHDSLRDLYEVSGVELDTIVEFCRTRSDIAGARMTGAGFGGCAIALVKKDSFGDFADQVTTYYTDRIGYAPSVYQSEIGDGAGRR